MLLVKSQYEVCRHTIRDYIYYTYRHTLSGPETTQTPPRFSDYVQCSVTTREVPGAQCWGPRGQGLVGRAFPGQPLQQSTTSKPASFHIKAAPAHFDSRMELKGSRSGEAHTGSREAVREMQGSMTQPPLSVPIIHCG